MNKLSLQLFAVGLCFAVGHALQCYKCLGFESLCPSFKTTCADGEQCYNGRGSAVGVVVIKKGCVAVENCNQTTTVTFPEGSGLTYNMTKNCCSTDLCNGVPGQPGASGLSLAAATITTLFVAKALV